MKLQECLAYGNLTVSDFQEMTGAYKVANGRRYRRREKSSASQTSNVYLVHIKIITLSFQIEIDLLL